MNVGLPYLQIQKRGYFERGRGEGYHILLVNFFVCEGAPLIKCKGEKEIASLISDSLIFIHHNREMGSIFNPLPDYSKSIKYSYHQFNARISIIWN